MGDIQRHHAAPVRSDMISALVLKGDLSGLSQQDKMVYYSQMCDRLGLDPLTQPFSLLALQGKQILYANKSCTEQLRKIHGVSITDVTAQKIEDVYVVTVKGSDKDGRTDGATGAVNITGLKGDALANAVMKAETKAKRRLTLSICGLGMLDETEIETIPEARTVPLASVTEHEPKVSLAPENVEETWEEVKNAEGVHARAPSAYWSKKGNKQGQQLALCEAFGPGTYKVEKVGESDWRVFRAVVKYQTVEGISEAAAKGDLQL